MIKHFESIIKSSSKDGTLGIAKQLVNVLRCLVDAKNVWFKEMAWSEFDTAPISLFNHKPIRTSKKNPSPTVKQLCIEDQQGEEYTYYFEESKQKLADAFHHTFHPTNDISTDTIQSAIVLILIVLKSYISQVKK